MACVRSSALAAEAAATREARRRVAERTQDNEDGRTIEEVRLVKGKVSGGFGEDVGRWLDPRNIYRRLHVLIAGLFDNSC
jgi:hypothetical protein